MGGFFVWGMGCPVPLLTRSRFLFAACAFPWEQNKLNATIYSRKLFCFALALMVERRNLCQALCFVHTATSLAVSMDGIACGFNYRMPFCNGIF